MCLLQVFTFQFQSIVYDAVALHLAPVMAVLFWNEDTLCCSMPFRPIWWRRCGLACDAIKIKWVAGLGRGFCYQLLVIAFCPSSIGLAAECVRFILGVRSKKHARNNLRTGENLWGETCGRSEKRLHLSEVGGSRGQKNGASFPLIYAPLQRDTIWISE